MAKNENLHKAKKAKADEFYTIYSDISSELGNYREHFRDKVIYCNCDDPTWSNFWRFFHNNFRSLGLKKLISTHYAEGEKESYALIYEGGDDFHMEVGEIIPISADEGFPEKENSYCAGDFRSLDCIRLLEEADIVSTNPPFSLFREYVSQLTKHKKGFVIIGNMNAITYKEIFPLIKNNEIWMGYRTGQCSFRVPDDFSRGNVFEGEDGFKYAKFGNICWYTNLDIKKRHDGLWHIGGKFDQTKAHRYYEGFEWYYKKYDNYDAINVDKVKEIPIDYSGVMGVPITWLDKYNPDEFEIVGGSMYDDTPCRIPRHYVELGYKFYKPDGITPSGSGALRDRVSPKIPGKGKSDYSISPQGECLTSVYQRIFIQNKNPINKADDKGY